MVGAAAHEVEDEPLFASRAAGIDIAKAGVEVTIRVPGRPGGPPPYEDPVFCPHNPPRDLLALADLANGRGGLPVPGMEATGDYGSRSTSPWNRRV